MGKGIAVAAALMLGVSAGALAQSSTNGATQTIKASQMRASKMLSTTVYDRNNQDVGSVQDLVLDKNGRVADVVVSVGTTMGVGGKDVAVAFRNFKFDNGRLTLDKTEGQLKQMASYQLENDATGSGSSAEPATGGHATGQ